jgi:hypothetical protein
MAKLKLEDRMTIQTLARRDVPHCEIARLLGKSVRDWTELLAGDEVLATAILDRLLHKAHVLNIKGRSYRLRDLEQSLGVQRQTVLQPAVQARDLELAEHVLAARRRQRRAK